jgi:RimJ/RimL family protein N-acetyltransferase
MAGRLASRVTLRPLTAEDGPRVSAWMRDPGLTRFTVLVPSPHHVFLGECDGDPAAPYLDQMLHDPGRVSFAILLDGEHVGNVGFKEYNPHLAEAECFVEVGDPALRGQGIGTQAMRLLLRHGFKVLGLREVRLAVFEFNHAAIRLYERLGFTRTAPVAWHWAEGTWHQVLGMTLVRQSRPGAAARTGGRHGKTTGG